ncbi:MAG: hypothetical protein MI861_09135, partial [Pirellulales bacterium]|nr:hypothetical protein [Pirellulales bacterium]
TKMVRKSKKRWGLAALATLVVSPSLALADLPNPVNQLGRVFGAGWGDGYHAREDSGIQLGADLPPQSYSQRGGRSVFSSTDKSGHRGVTFYDRFDAMDRAAHRQPTSPQHRAPRIIIDGSQVIQTPQPATPTAPRQPSPTIAPPAQRPIVPPTLTPPHTPNSPPTDSSAITIPQTSSPRPAATSARKRPIRPREPQQPALPQRLPTEGAARAERPASAALALRPAQPSSTPSTITPQHPGFRFMDRNERLLQQALGGPMKMPLATDHKISQRPTTMIQHRLPALPPAPAATIHSPQQPPPHQPANRPTRPRPARLGAGGSESPQHGRIAVLSPRPTPKPSLPVRIPPLPNGVRTNPWALPRADVDLAERNPAPGANVIVQPR